MNKSKFQNLLNSKYFTMFLSFVMAVAIWIVVVTFFSTDARTTIKDVPINVEYNATYLNLDMEIIDQNISTVDVTVVGPRNVVGALTKDDIIVYPQFSNVRVAGKYELPLNAVKTSTIMEYQIESLSSYQVQINFDHLTEKTFRLESDISNLTIPSDLMVDKITVTPENVTVKGPENTINKIATVVAVVSQQEVSQSVVIPAELMFFDENGDQVESRYLEYDVGEFNITVPVLKEITVPVVVDFTNVPSGFDTATLKLALSQNEITLAVPSRSADNIHQFVAGYIALDVLELNKPYVFDVNLPSGYKNIKDVAQISATISDDNIDSKSISVKEIKLINEGEQNVEILTEVINHVELVGDKTALKELTASQVIAQIDMSKVSLAQGQQTVEVDIIITSSSKVFARGTYYATIRN